MLAATVLAATACSGARQAAAGTASASPAPLGACETRITDFDGVGAVITSNADGTLASVDIIKAANAAARAKAVDDAVHYFGPVHRDTRVMVRQSKWGLSVLTDSCGRPVEAPPR